MRIAASMLLLTLTLLAAPSGAAETVRVAIGTQDTTINCAAGGPLVRELHLLIGGRCRSHRRRVAASRASHFLGLASGLAAGALALTRARDAHADPEPAAHAGDAAASALDRQLRRDAFRVRVAAARANDEVPLAPHPTNGEEERYSSKIGTDTRAAAPRPAGRGRPRRVGKRRAR